jgi:hypothetical protein
MSSDPHRAAGCYLRKSDILSVSVDGKDAEYALHELKWLEQLDWAVYHAPQWQMWQAFREALVLQQPVRRLNILDRWPTDTAQDLIRVLNYTRSMRSFWKDFPGWEKLSAELHQRYQDEVKAN